jgi:SAM-dependent methyltransferase
MKTLMQLIKHVLDDAYRSIHTTDEAEKDKSITKELEALSREYGSLTNSKAKPIDYSDPLKRFAYIYKYTVAHADYIMQLISFCPPLRKLLARKSVEVACLGGGPGSDLLGVLKHMIQTQSKETCLTCYIFDKERAWGDSWSDVARCLDAPFRVYPVFQQMDVTDSSTWESYSKFLRADLFTLSYFLSEVWQIRARAEPFFNHCFANMKAGGLVLFIDNNAPVFFNWFDAIAKRHNLEAVKTGSTTLAFSNDEEKTDLGVYFKKFGWPKRKGDVAYRVMRKA